MYKYKIGSKFVLNDGYLYEVEKYGTGWAMYAGDKKPTEINNYYCKGINIYDPEEEPMYQWIDEDTIKQNRIE